MLTIAGRTAAITDRLKTIANGLAADGEATWYLFGSVTRSPATAKDVDVLVVCDTDQTANVVRARLHDLCLQLPLHLILMTVTEEAELRFVQNQNCVPLLPSPAPSDAQDTAMDPR